MANMQAWERHKLVFCGHSQGGGVSWYLAVKAYEKKVRSFHLFVAAYCLKQISDTKYTNLEIKCNTFGQPWVGDKMLNDYIMEKGWDNVRPVNHPSFSHQY